jgi:NADH-quinone oxidoreductase subunit H
MGLVYFLVEVVIKAIVVFACLMLTVAYLTWAERKILGHVQVRYGPNRAGPFGLLQPFADGIKAFFKEDLIPGRADKVCFVIAPMIVIVSAISLFAVIPFGNKMVLFGREIKLVIADLDVGILYIFALASLGEYGVVLGGWSSGNKYGLTGALRAAAMMISYEVALGLSIMGVLLISQSLRLTDIVLGQGGGFWHWNVWLQPVAFVLYMVCGLAELSRTPFDMPEAESELACGFNIEYSSMKFALFFMGEYAHLVAVCAVGATLFLGGWQPPHPTLSFIPGVIWFFVKVVALIFFCIWERGTFPRLRYDQIMYFGWKFLFPLALVNLVVTAIIVSIR